MASKLSDGASAAAKSSVGSLASSKSSGTAPSPAASKSTSSKSSPVAKSTTVSYKAPASLSESVKSTGSSKSAPRASASSLSSGSSSGGGQNLRGNASESIKRTGVTTSDTSRRRATENPSKEEVSRISEQLAALNAMTRAEKRREERAAEGVEPSEGMVDWNGMLYDANAPYRNRVERAGGAPFEGPIDWGGIGAAIFGGQSAAERDALMLAERQPKEVPWNSYSPLNVTEPFDWDEFQSYVGSDAFGAPQRDKESGFILDPVTGTYYREDMLPGTETRLAENPVASQQFPSFAPLEGLMAGLHAEGERWNGTDMPPLPRRDPRGGIAAATPLPGQVEGERAPVEIEVRGGNGKEEPKKKTPWDSVVEMGGGLLEHTGLGGIVKGLFPDIWYGAGETMKGLDNGLTYGGGAASGGTNFEYLPQNGSLSEQSPGGYDFIDANHNGIDDRLEGGAVPPPYVPSTAPNARVARFPSIPPYNPGRDNEWDYFTNNRLAHGGIVQAYAEGGAVTADDPKIRMIGETEDVLEKLIGGEKPGKAETVVLKKFVEAFGDGALRQLHDSVKQGFKMNGPAGGRMVTGPGGPTDDAIPAVIDGQEPAALSSGEFVLPAAAVAGAGDGDPEKGAAALQELSERLSAGMKAA